MCLGPFLGYANEANAEVAIAFVVYCWTSGLTGILLHLLLCLCVRKSNESFAVFSTSPIYLVSDTVHEMQMCTGGYTVCRAPPLGKHT